MKNHTRWIGLVCAMSLVLIGADGTQAVSEQDLKTIETYMSAGKTLPPKFCEKFPFPGRLRKNDTGINILFDQAHQTTFALLWGMRGVLNREGFRVCTSIACLDSVLAPNGFSRVRLKVGKLEPYAWWSNANYNVIITTQRDLKAQHYTPKEQQALKRFVESGGGLLVLGGGIPRNDKEASSWSLNQVLGQFGAGFTSRTDRLERKKYSALKLSSEWEILKKGSAGAPLRARRIFRKGRVMIVESPDIYTADKRKVKPEIAERNRVALSSAIKWLAAGKKPVGGNRIMPNVGGVGIFPEKETHLGSIIIYYASNQPEEVKKCIIKDIPNAAMKLRQWLPGKVYAEPFAIVMAAGIGGGWAINPRPKAAVIITYQPLELLGIFAHEMAHTMGGPRNNRGELAGYSPHHNQGESHAGWFQGKILAFYDPKRREKPNRNCNSILQKEAMVGKKVDVANFNRDEWGKGMDWVKHWYIFQKLDDRYGPTWYPRWYWVRNMRWADDPDHKLTWDETVEDMCIAVEEDLFPFFKKIGTSLKRDRLEKIEFLGKTITLPVAPIDDGPAGKVCLEPVGDYRKPLKPRLSGRMMSKTPAR